MRTLIIDSEALRAIAPTALLAYARAEGWHRAERFGEHSDVYQRVSAPELILPGTDALADYAQIVANVIRTLSSVESRDEEQVYRDLVGSDRDVIRVRVPKANDDGSISLESGMQLVSQARNMLLSAACAATESRAAFRAGKMKDASAYLDRVRLGQTEAGSFIVTLLAPVPLTLEGGQQGTFWPVESEEPFERKVTRTLAKSLMAARVAAEGAVRGEGMAAFEQAVTSGVSANLCDALSTLITTGAGLDVSVTWARTRPTPESRSSITFRESEAEVFEEAARRFRSLEPRPDETIDALVVALDRKPDAIEGRIRLKTFIDNQAVSVQVTLPSDKYHLAVQAHDTRSSVKISGDLERHNQRWVLVNPRNVQVVPDESLDEPE